MVLKLRPVDDGWYWFGESWAWNVADGGAIGGWVWEEATRTIGWISDKTATNDRRPPKTNRRIEYSTN